MPLPYVWKPSSDPEQRMGLMIWSYFDESGKLASANDVICLCGYLGDEHWEQFTEEWGVLLKQHNLPSIHMARLRSRKPPFEHIDWDEDQEKKILRRFVEPIRKHTAAFFSVSVDVKHYRSMPREAREAFGQKTALDFSFQRLIRLVISQLQTWNVDYGI